MFKYKSIGFYGEAGPYVGFLASGKIKAKTSSNTTKVDIENTFDCTGMGVAAGTVYVINSG